MKGDLFLHAGITATEAFLGYVIGGTLGMAFGTLLGRSRVPCCSVRSRQNSTITEAMIQQIVSFTKEFEAPIDAAVVQAAWTNKYVEKAAAP